MLIKLIPKAWQIWINHSCDSQPQLTSEERDSLTGGRTKVGSEKSLPSYESLVPNNEEDEDDNQLPSYDEAKRLRETY